MANAQLKIVRHAELTKVGNRAASIFGYRNDLVEEHLKWHLTQMSNKWCSVDCMSRTMFGRATETNRGGIRKRMASTFRKLLERGLFLVVEYDATPTGHGKIKACKIYESVGGAESEYARNQIERMAARKEMSEEMRLRALSILGTECIK